MNRRTPYQGVFQIVCFNRTAYARAVLLIAVSLLAAAAARPTWRIAILAAAAPLAYWTCASLVVSYCVYDRHPLYQLEWLSRVLTAPPRSWLCLHAGLDEFSSSIHERYPSATSCVLDLYDPAQMTEPSIHEARRCFPAPHARADWRALPLPDAAFDAVFLLFAAHELRSPAARTRCFAEAARALRPAGELALLEHLRDWPNFAAFGPGFLHFFTARTWLRDAAAAGLVLRRSDRVTPFVRLFIFARPQ